MLVCCSDNNGTVVRYNISQNDHARLFHMADGNANLSIYNNVFFVGKGDDVQLFLWTGHGEEWTHGARIANNIFYVAGNGPEHAGKIEELGRDFRRRTGLWRQHGHRLREERSLRQGGEVPAEWRA